jgi:hypothetical protein
MAYAIIPGAPRTSQVRHPGLDPGSMPQQFRNKTGGGRAPLEGLSLTPPTIWNGSRIKSGMTKREG